MCALAPIVSASLQRLLIFNSPANSTDIANTLFEGLKPIGVMVVIEAAHTCMTLRGVRKADAKTVTSAVLGGFRTDPRTRAEAMALITGRE